MGLLAGTLALGCGSDDSSDPTGPTSSSGSTTAADTSGGTTSTTPPATTSSTTELDGTSTDTTAAGTTDSTGATTDGDSTEESGSSTGAAAGLGELSGECGLIDAMELRSASPFTFENAIDFRDAGFDYDELTPDGQAVFDAGNLGGSSLHSEVISFEVLARCDGATLIATEGEIEYTDDMGTKTDILVDIGGLMVGVSVTRAVGFPQDDPYTVDQATVLLEDKLGDVLASTANVAPEDAWVKQVLHVIAYADMHAESIFAAYAGLDAELTADTILLVTVTHGDDAFVY